ncbi:ABC transporter permease [Propionibacteriaceae bacterium Y1923]
MVTALEVGLLYAIMALGVYLTYRVLDFPDLTVDGSFTMGAATAAVLIVGGVPPVLGMLAGTGAGVVAGFITGALHAWGGINPLLAGILTQIGLWSINLRIMGRANLSLLRERTVFTPLREAGLMGSWWSVLLLAAVSSVAVLVLFWFLRTAYGVAIRATGDNQEMASSQGINTAWTKITGLALSNGLVAFCGTMVTQYQGYADISMGVGLVVAGLASVILGQAIFGMSKLWQAIAAAALGSVLYRLAIQIALDNGLDPNDMKLVSALLVVAALLIPKWAPLRRFRMKRRHGAPPEPVSEVPA